MAAEFERHVGFAQFRGISLSSDSEQFPWRSQLRWRAQKSLWPPVRASPTTSTRIFQFDRSRHSLFATVSAAKAVPTKSAQLM